VAINRDKVLEAAQKFVEKKKYDKAVLEYRKLIDADPNDARTLLKIGDLQAKQGLYVDAISSYETVGKLYAQQGFALKAIAVYKQIREIIAKHVPQQEERYGHITPKLAELYQQLGLTSDALSALDEVATRLQRQQRDPEAIDVFRKIVELDPTNPLPHLRLAEALSRVKDVDGAVFEFKTAASQLAGIGRRDDALKVLERLLHHKPDAEQAKIAAELYLSRGQPADGMQALAKLQICFQANPRDFDTLSLLARAFNAIGQGAKAIEVQKEMARVARDAGKTDLFREIVERLMRVAPQDEGVRKLAGQSGGFGGGAQYGAPAAPQAPSGGYPQASSGGYPQASSGGYPQASSPYGAPMSSGSYGAQAPMPPTQSYPHAEPRPATQPLQRPMTSPIDQHNAQRGMPPPPPPASRPEPPPVPAAMEDEIDELSYQEVEDAEVVEEAEVEAYEEDAPAYDAGEYAEVQAEGYETAEGQQAYGADPYAEGAQQFEGAVVGEGDAMDGDAEIAAGDVDAGELIAKSLADANAFRRVRLYNKALETLRAGLEIDPRSMDIHEVYRDILIESGQTEDAVQEMLVIASLYIDALDGESAARALQDVLAFDPQNARAVDMLQELGYEIADENEEAAAGEGLDAQGGEAYAADDDGHERLPSYDLEEMGPADVGAQYADDRQVYVGRQPSESYADDGGALPSFPLDEADPEAAQAYADAAEEMPGVVGSSTTRPEREPSMPAPAMTPSMAAAASRELEDALDEAEFFCSRGLFEDAKAILQEQLGKHPNNPLLRERLQEIDAQEVQRGSGARERPKEQDRSFDIAASLDAIESLDYGGGGTEPGTGFQDPDQQVDVEEVFAKFKEGVAQQISVDDSDSHYNLGIAYKEMMLLDDAIREFELAAQDQKRECVCRSMIGMIEIERGRLNEAIDAFLQGLNAPIKDPSQETVLCFEIGAAYEAKKMNKEALSYYQKAMRRDPNYRDVQERVRRLSKNEPKAPIKAAVGADDEFDRAFDDLLGKA
jgi:tetratricopeptide (TPR) repeat protein